jgi:hypothetical protein
MPTNAKWYGLYQNNRDFRLWFDNLARGSPTTAIESARVLYRSLGIIKLDLDQLTNLIKTDRDGFEKKLMEFVSAQEKEGYAPGTIHAYTKTFRSWASWHGQALVRNIKISNPSRTPTLDNEQVPTPQQVNDIRSAASLRGRVCVDVVAYGGTRLEVLGHQHLHDGLKLGDLPELDLEKLVFTKTPTLVEVREPISKAGHRYRTFLPQETCRDILAYLKYRMSLEEELDAQSPLVSVSSSHNRRGWRSVREIESNHIVAAVVGRDIRSAMRPMFNYRPYVLRSFFSTRLLMAVSEGVVDNNYRVYWMGHQGIMSARYSTNKAMLPPDLVESMRDSYKRCLPYLLGVSLNEEDMRRKQVIDTAKMLGFGEERISKLREILARSKSVDDAVEEIRKLSLEPPKSNTYENRLVDSEKEMMSLLNQGWEIERELNGGGKFLMRRLIK